MQELNLHEITLVAGGGCSGSSHRNYQSKSCNSRNYSSNNCNPKPKNNCGSTPSVPPVVVPPIVEEA